jgi:chaperone required for assembly of F1-ATPase
LYWVVVWAYAVVVVAGYTAVGIAGDAAVADIAAEVAGGTEVLAWPLALAALHKDFVIEGSLASALVVAAFAAAAAAAAAVLVEEKVVLVDRKLVGAGQEGVENTLRLD